MLKQSIAAIALCFSAQAFAGPVYEFSDPNANSGGPLGDVLDSIHYTWDAGEELLTWKTTFTSAAVDSFWLVVNDGPNPKVEDTNELVIMYGDLDRGTVTSYVYNGANNANSYNTPGYYLQTDALTVLGNTISFSIDGTAMNNEPVPGDYRGLIAGPESLTAPLKAGIWFHFAQNSAFSYDGDEILSYRFGRQGWYDRAHLDIAKVPEPETYAMIGIGLLSVFGLRRRQALQRS